MEFLHSITSYLVIFDLLYASAVCFLKVCTYTRIKDLIFSSLEFFLRAQIKFFSHAMESSNVYGPSFVNLQNKTSFKTY